MSVAVSSNPLHPERSLTVCFDYNRSTKGSPSVVRLETMSPRRRCRFALARAARTDSNSPAEQAKEKNPTEPIGSDAFLPGLHRGFDAARKGRRLRLVPPMAVQMGSSLPAIVDWPWQADEALTRQETL